MREREREREKRDFGVNKATEDKKLLNFVLMAYSIDVLRRHNARNKIKNIIYTRSS